VTAEFRIIEVERVAPGARTRAADASATEAALEVRLHGEPFAVIMRTPGLDRDLAAGFLLSEQVVRAAAEIRTIEAGTDTDTDSSVNVMLRADAAQVSALLDGRRRVTQNSACGMCGRPTGESLRVDAAPVTATWTVTPDLVPKLAERLRAAQEVFGRTGGLHAAGLFDRDGTLVASAEDVGRHNAVDKVIGRMLLAGRLPLDGCLLFVSGRTSFEIVQKAAVAGIPVVAAVSAPSTMAIDLAAAMGITLIGFARGESFNIYANGWRISGDRS